MIEPYLILHKVRGEPAFDIAIKLTSSDPNHVWDENDPVWIIPTSGHRAYPICWWLVKELRAADGWDAPIEVVGAMQPGMKDLPDHYSCNDRKATPDVYEVKTRAAGLLEALNLVKKVNVERRF